MQIRQHNHRHAHNAKHPTHIHPRANRRFEHAAYQQRRYHHFERKNQRHHRGAAVYGGVIQQQITEGKTAQPKPHHRTQ